MTPKIRQSIYYLGTVASALVGIALIWGGIEAGAAQHVSSLITGLVALAGGAAPAVAARKVGEQMKDGSFDSSPADQVIKGIEAVVNARANVEAEVNRVRDAVTAVVDDIPVLGPLAKNAIDNLKFD